MNSYQVEVRNETTGEVHSMTVHCEDPRDAQIQALVTLFRSQGWRKAVAQPALPSHVQ